MIYLKQNRFNTKKMDKRGKNATMFENIKNCGAGKFISNGEWCHPDRTIDSYEIIYVTKGDVFICENGVKYHLKKDELLVLHPNIRHYGYKTSSNTEFFWLHWYDGPAFTFDIKYKKLTNPYNTLLYFRQILAARVSHKTSESIDYLTRLILIEIFSNSQNPKHNHNVEKIVAWIDANRHTAITTTQLSEVFGYNADYLNRLFKSAFSKTIKQYIDDKRIEYIKELMLSDNLSLKKVAEKTGFTEYKYFLKFFKYHEKITPTEFCKLYVKMHINSH